MATEINMKHYSVGAVDVVAAEGELSLLNVAGIRESTLAVAESAANMVMDLREVSYIDSAGLELLIALYHRLSKRDKVLSVLVRKGSQADEVIHIVRLDTVAKVTTDPREVGLEE